MILPLIFGLIALILLFFKLPAVAGLVGILNCAGCILSLPYLPVIAAGYFSAFLACILCFPTLPNTPLRAAGLVWSIGLAITLTYLSPVWCVICLIAHGCHILMWIFWRPREKKPEKLVAMKVALVFTSAFAVMALFTTLNLTFLLYGPHEKNHHEPGQIPSREMSHGKK